MRKAGSSGRGALGPRAHRRYGMTLIELMMGMAVAMGALALALSGFSMLSEGMIDEQHLTRCQLEQHEAFIAIEKDLRNAGSNPRQGNLYPASSPLIELVPPQEPLRGGLRLRADLTGAGGEPDGDLEDAGEVVIYAFDAESGQVNRWVTTGSGGMISAPILREVERFEVVLADRHGAPVSASAARQVQIVFTTRVDPADPRPNAPARTQRFTVVLPNRQLSGT